MNIFEYSDAVKRMREYFQDKLGYVEVPAQSRQSILAACEDPATISQYIFSGINWPLPQTGQMWLEKELLENPDLPGVFCITTSYRNEPNPIPGRHDKIFPMFEFEGKGSWKDMVGVERGLLKHLGFYEKNSHDMTFTYDDLCHKYSTDTLDAKEEARMGDDISPIIFLTKFPLRTDPFWNMKQAGKLFNKVDVIMYGMETIGSAERSTNVEEMRHNFYTISNGEYANLLFNHFGRRRVELELEEYFTYDMFQRFGGGIGLTRMTRAMRMAELF